MKRVWICGFIFAAIVVFSLCLQLKIDGLLKKGDWRGVLDLQWGITDFADITDITILIDEGKHGQAQILMDAMVKQCWSVF